MKKTIQNFAEDLSKDIIDAGFEEEYKKNAGKTEGAAINKDGLVALCQLVEPSTLRDMLVYNRADSRYPSNLYKRSGGDVPDEEDWSELLDHMTTIDSVAYDVWHQFQFNGVRYVAIEKEDRDGVERQVGNNIEEEPANLIILAFQKEYLNIYADTRSTADSVQTGVNDDLSGPEYKEDKNTVDSDTVGDFAEELSKRDKDRDSPDSDENYEYIMTELWVDSTQLTNNPGIKIDAAGGVGKAISELNEMGLDLLADSRNISKMKMVYEGSIFIIKNVERSGSSDGTYRELVYGTEAPPEIRREFESLIDDEFGIRLVYKSSASR